MNVITQGSPQEIMWIGFIPFGYLLFIGFKLTMRGIRDDIMDSLGQPLAGRSWFIVGGILLQLTFVGYALFVWKQGLFDSK